MSLNNIPYFTLGSNQGLIKGRWLWRLTKRTTTNLLPTIPLLQSQCCNLAWLICASKTPAILNRFPSNSLALWATAERAWGRGIARGLRGNQISWKASAGVFKYTEEIDQRGREGKSGMTRVTLRWQQRLLQNPASSPLSKCTNTIIP